LDHQPLTPSLERETALEAARHELALRLDDLRGFGLLPVGDALSLEGEGPLLGLARSLADTLEATQRRVIETSIQILSLRELVAKLLRLRTPGEVAETVTLYLQKAFDHERVLVGVYYAGSGVLEGWTAVRDGGSVCRPFRLEGTWTGALRDAVIDNEAIGAYSGRRPLLNETSTVPLALLPFQGRELGAYLVYPLRGRGQKEQKVVGVLMVGEDAKGSSLGETEAGILESVVDAVGTAMENVILEEDVRREEAFRKDIMGSMASGLIAVDLKGDVLTLNAAAEKLTGQKLEALRGGGLAALEGSGNGVTALLDKTLRTRRPLLGAERAVRRAEGGAFPASCQTSLLRNPKGEVYGAVVTFTDLTEIKGMEARIRALDRLAALGRFTASIAHEIRNPLTGIGTGVQYLKRHLGEDASQRENLDFIQTEIARLDRIVEDLFRVTHPQPLRKTLEDPRGLVERAIRGLGTLPADHEVAVITRFAADLPAVPVDPDQMQQVLLNLIKNAVEAAPTGGQVEVHVHSAPDATRPRLVIRVVDTGAGIEPETLPHIFEPFFTKGKPKGTGLGLYVSHGIVERHGGEITAANEDGKGAVFTLTLPLDSYDAAEIQG
jgi:two-component system sensor histidine kinase AtoS